jgi:hypothetical protein
LIGIDFLRQFISHGSGTMTKIVCSGRSRYAIGSVNGDSLVNVCLITEDTSADLHYSILAEISILFGEFTILIAVRHTHNIVSNVR